MKTKMKNILNKAKLFGFFLATGMFLILKLVLGKSFIFSFLIAAVIYIGIYMLGSSRMDREIKKTSKVMTPESLMERIEESHKRAKMLKRLAKDIKDERLQTRIYRISDLADKIFTNFKSDSSDVAKASRFLLYFDRFLLIVKRYLKITSTKEGRETLAQNWGQYEFVELLDTVEISFNKGFKNYLDNDVAELKTVSKTLKKMMQIAEIGE